MDENFILTTPVALAIFNRPDTTLKVFERIRRARPQKLFIYSDGSRDNKPGEAEKVQECRDIIKKIDWNCEVHLNFSDKNLGCRRRMSSGISWVFEHVEEAIILEDDCLPSMSFFRFCQELLKKYRNDTRVTSISGSNHGDMENFNESYAFSNYFGCWGWATWKRAWKLYDDDMKMWSECRKNEWLRKVYPQDWRYTYMTNEFQMTYNGQIDSWAYRFLLANILNHALAIVPRVNMVRNIGFKVGATHTADLLNKNAFYMEEDLQFPLIHPQVIFPRDKFTPPPVHLHPNIMPSDEELQAEFEERFAQFQQLLSEQKYSEIILYFKDTLKNCRFIRPEYVYCLAYAYLMLDDFEHAKVLAEDIIKLNVMPPQSFIKFAETFLSKRKFDEGLFILEKIFERVQISDKDFQANLKNFIQSNNLQIEKYPRIYKFIME